MCSLKSTSRGCLLADCSECSSLGCSCSEFSPGVGTVRLLKAVGAYRGSISCGLIMRLVADSSACMKIRVEQKLLCLGVCVCLGWGAWRNYSDFLVLQLSEVFSISLLLH